MEWIACSERMPEPYSEQDHNGELLLYVIDKNEPTRKGVYTGSLREVPKKADPEGKDNFWGAPTYSSDWYIRGWSYFFEPMVTHWMPLPEPPIERGA